jgi:hypothetical protein
METKLIHRDEASQCAASAFDAFGRIHALFLKAGDIELCG